MVDTLSLATQQKLTPLQLTRVSNFTAAFVYMAAYDSNKYETGYFYEPIILI